MAAAAKHYDDSLRCILYFFLHFFLYIVIFNTLLSFIPRPLHKQFDIFYYI